MLQFSPTSEHILLAYGRRHGSLLKSIVVDGETTLPIYTVLEVNVFSCSAMTLPFTFFLFLLIFLHYVSLFSPLVLSFPLSSLPVNFILALFVQFACTSTSLQLLKPYFVVHQMAYLLTLRSKK